jgi:hypothetical protein
MQDDDAGQTKQFLNFARAHWGLVRLSRVLLRVLLSRVLPRPPCPASSASCVPRPVPRVLSRVLSSVPRPVVPRPVLCDQCLLSTATNLAPVIIME